MSSDSVHLLVLVHGMWGNPGHLAELNRIILETQSTVSKSPSLHVLLAETNREDATYDGIDWGGERVAQEVAEELDKLQKSGKTVTRFSITGYSLGGLVSRYVVGILHQRGFFQSISPVNFNTIATPHIGLLRYPSIMSSLFSSLGPKLLSRTGEQFYCVDQWSTTGKPLLEVMADPARIFYQGLALFKHIRIYGNAIHDITVPYVTSAIEIEDPFAEFSTNGIEVELDEEYSPLIKSYFLPPVPPPRAPKPAILSLGWFRSLKPKRPLLPPVFQVRFPFNLAIYALLPFLLPVVLSLVVVRLALATRSSRARIKLLEKDASNSDKLVHILAQLERQVEDAVVDFIDDPDPSPSPSKSNPSSEHPIITPLQRKMAASLNELPIEKKLAYIREVRNSHAVIICRDVKRFEVHRKGEGVLRHWADSFDL